MNNVCDLISMPIISLFEGNYEGIIKNILFDNKLKKAVYFVILDDINDEEKALPVNKVYSKNDAVMIKSSSDLIPLINIDLEIESLVNPINSSAYTCLGKCLGKVKDIVLDDKYKISQVILDTQNLDAHQILNFGKQIVVFCDNNVKVNINKFGTKPFPKFSPKDNIVVKAMDVDNDNQKISLPTKQVANHKVLLNRKVSQNIIANNGEIIIRQNTKINSSTIEMAKSYGLLAQLTKYSY